MTTEPKKSLTNQEKPARKRQTKQGQKRQTRPAQKRNNTEPKRNVEDFDLEKARQEFNRILSFARLAKTNIWNVNDTTTKLNPRYTRYSKEDLLDYMQSPASNEKNIRNASIYMFDASTQYKRLILYYAYLLDWAYTIAPIGFEPSDINQDSFTRYYYKAISEIETMNLKHEMQKASVIALRDGILYGAIWKTSGSFYIQRINPDYCVLTSIEDGTWMYSVDMSQIKETQLNLYPPEFTVMYEAYKAGGNKYQEVPSSISFCLKADEASAGYSLPPWASTLPMLYDIETYKALQETATEIANYKLLAMKIDLDSNGVPTLDWDLAQKYYLQLCSSLPPYVGAAVTPMDIQPFDFDKSHGPNDVDTVSRAEEQYWFSTGTSALLHGSINSNAAGVLRYSIKSDEEIMFGLQNQAERLINRILKSMGGPIKFKIRFLPVTIFNRDEQTKLYKEAATLGIPGSKIAYASSIGIPQSDLLGLNYVEIDVLHMDKLIPLTSGYTVSSDNPEGGAPEKDPSELSDEGAATKEGDKNNNYK